MRVGLDVSIVCSDYVLSVDQQTHHKILRSENAKACDCSELGQVWVGTKLEDELE